MRKYKKLKYKTMVFKIVGDRGGRQARTVGLRKYIQKLKYKTMVYCTLYKIL